MSLNEYNMGLLPPFYFQNHITMHLQFALKRLSTGYRGGFLHCFLYSNSSFLAVDHDLDDVIGGYFA